MNVMKTMLMMTMVMTINDDNEDDKCDEDYLAVYEFGEGLGEQPASPI